MKTAVVRIHETGDASKLIYEEIGIKDPGVNVTDFKIGDRVAYSGPIGSHAQHVLRPAEKLIKIPEFIDDKTAAGADHVILQENFAQKIRKITNSQGVDVVYDGIGKATFMASLIA